MVRTRLRINPVWLSGNREHLIVGVGKQSRTLFGHGDCKGSTRYWNSLKDCWPCTGGLSAVCMYVCMVITCSRVWINRVRLPILLVVS